jgi:hypothetical protein
MDVKTNLSGFQMAKNKNGCQTIWRPDQSFLLLA